MRAAGKKGYRFSHWKTIKGQVRFIDSTEAESEFTLIENATIQAVSDKVETFEVYLRSHDGKSKKMIIQHEQ